LARDTSGIPLALIRRIDPIPEREDAMAVRKPRRSRKLSAEQRMIALWKSFRVNRWNKTTAVSGAVAFIVFLGVLGFAYNGSPPASDGSHSTPARQLARSETPAAPVVAESPAADISLTADVEAEAGSIELERETVPTATLTGCLERADDEFRLNDTTGTKAPKARSWKSAFLTKRPASVTVVPDSTALQLSRHVGYRVTVTGPLQDREMRIKTLRRVSPCGTGPRVAA
jgi:hypothetical protein